MEIQFKKFSSKAVKPFLATQGSGCYDLCSANEYQIHPNIGLEIPHGFIGKIFTRSSWVLKFTSVEGRVIDSGYRGSIKIICHNKSTTSYDIETGQSIAQIAFFRSEIVKFVEVLNFEVLNFEVLTLHGEKGFGFTDTDYC